MKFDHLKAFQRIAVTGSFTRAARELFLTQPAVSQQIQMLERDLGAVLFDRSGKNIRLTGEGKILFEQTEQLFQIYNKIEMLFGRLHSLEKGSVTIGSTAVLGTYFLPKILGRYSKKYPGIDLDLHMGNSHAVITMLLTGQVELGFAGRVSEATHLQKVLVHREKLSLVAAPDNPLTGEKSVKMRQLTGIPFIWREKGTRTRDLVQKWFENRTDRNYPKRSIELQSVEAAKRTVMEGYGITVVPEISVMRELHLGLLKCVPLSGFDLAFDYYLFYKKGKIFSRAVEKLLEMISGFQQLSHAENLKNIFSHQAAR